MSEWVNEDITKFILSNKLPSYMEKDDTIIEYTKKYRARFMSNYDNMLLTTGQRAFPSNVYDSIKKIRSAVDEVFDSVIVILQYYEMAEMSKAQYEFDTLMCRLKTHLIITGIYYDPSSPMRLYRVRPTDKKIEERRELFHVPNKERRLVKNERYSLAGAPCLYLATSLGIAWEECDMPRSYCFSEYKITDESYLVNWRFITLMDPWEFSVWELLRVKNEDISKQTQRICDYLLTFPVIFSCSIVNRWGDSSFKEEYIFPQLLLQWVKRNQGEIRGVNYFSCVHTTETSRWNGHNVVLPTSEYDSNGYDKQLSSAFFLSTPVFHNLEVNDSDIMDLKILEERIKAAVSDNYFEFLDLLFLMHDTCNLLLSIACDVNASPLTRMRSLRMLLRTLPESYVYDREQQAIDGCKDIYKTDAIIFDKKVKLLHDICVDFNTIVHKRAFLWKNMFGGNDNNDQDFKHI